MSCRPIRTLVLTLVVLCLGASLVGAEIMTIKGKIQSMQADKASFTLMTEAHQTLAFTTPADLLEDMQLGDEVLVTVDNGEVIAISPDRAGPQD